jgi:hypothetical protein
MSVSRKRALIIANQLYDDSRFTELPGAASDAKHLAKTLKSPTIGEFDVQIVPDKDSRTVRRAIEAFFKEAARQDLLLLHWSCHGKREDWTGELHFVTRDTDFDHLVNDSPATSAPSTWARTPLRSRRAHCAARCWTAWNGSGSLADVDPRTSIATGAAFQAGVLDGTYKDSLPLDVISISLGLEAAGGVIATLIERNTVIPAKQSAIFTTAEDNQPSVRVQIFQGQHELHLEHPTREQAPQTWRPHTETSLPVPIAPRDQPKKSRTPLLWQVDLDASLENGHEHAVHPGFNWGSRGRRFTSRQPDDQEGPAAHRPSRSPLCHLVPFVEPEHAAHTRLDSTKVATPRLEPERGHLPPSSVAPHRPRSCGHRSPDRPGPRPRSRRQAAAAAALSTRTTGLPLTPRLFMASHHMPPVKGSSR